MKKIILCAISIISLLLFGGCKEMEEISTPATYEIISQDYALSLMNNDTIVLDARTPEEFSEGHIKNAINIPYDEIDVHAEKMLPDKSQLILVYCRSGRRSKIAAESLVNLGYTNVKEFGGIIDWKYETVIE